MKVFLKVLFAVLGIVGILIIGLGIAGYFFFTNPSFRDSVTSKISISNMFANSKPRDLGITYSDTDLENAYSKSGTMTEILQITGDTPLNPNQTVIGDGSKSVDVELTSEEATALINKWSDAWVYAPVSNVQYRINPDNTGEVSAVFDVNKAINYAKATGVPEYIVNAVTDYIKPLGTQFPVYMKGTLEIVNNKVDLNLSDVKIGFLSAKLALNSGLKSQVDQFVEDRLTGGMVNEQIESFKMQDGKALVKGVIPEKVTYVK